VQWLDWLPDTTLISTVCMHASITIPYVLISCSLDTIAVGAAFLLFCSSCLLDARHYFCRHGLQQHYHTGLGAYLVSTSAFLLFCSPCLLDARHSCRHGLQQHYHTGLGAYLVSTSAFLLFCSPCLLDARHPCRHGVQQHYNFIIQDSVHTRFPHLHLYLFMAFLSFVLFLEKELLVQIYGPFCRRLYLL